MLRLRQALAVVQQQLAPLLPACQIQALSTQKERAIDKAARKEKAVHIVLLQDVFGLGRRGEVKPANPGWVRHKLFPRGAALYATPENVGKYAKGAEDQPEHTDKELAMEKEILRMLRILAHRLIDISRKAADNPLPPTPTEGPTAEAVAAAARNDLSDSTATVGQEGEGEADTEGEGVRLAAMKGSVTPFDILQAVVRQTGVKLHASHLLMDKPITTFGTFKIPLNFRMLDNHQIELQVRVHRVKALKHGKASV